MDYFQGVGFGVVVSKVPKRFLLHILSCTFFMFMPFRNSDVAINIVGFGETPSQKPIIYVLDTNWCCGCGVCGECKK